LFNSFWENYPRKQAKKQAKKSFLRLNGKVKIEELLDHVKRQKQPGGILAREPQYIPMAASYLNGERWKDENARPAKTQTPW